MLINCCILDHVCSFFSIKPSADWSKFALKSEHARFLQDFIAWPKCFETITTKIEKSRDPNSSDRKVLFRKFRVEWQTLTQVNATLFSESNIVSTKPVQWRKYHAVHVQVNPPNLQQQFQSRNVRFVLNHALETLIKYHFFYNIIHQRLCIETRDSQPF